MSKSKRFGTKEDCVEVMLDGYGVVLTNKFNGNQAWTRVTSSDAEMLGKYLIEAAKKWKVDDARSTARFLKQPKLKALERSDEK